MTQEIRRRNEPLLVGGMYGQGTSHYLVTEHLEGFTLPTVHLRRQDGWELDAVEHPLVYNILPKPDFLTVRIRVAVQRTLHRRRLHFLQRCFLRGAQRQAVLLIILSLFIVWKSRKRNAILRAISRIDC